jgi:hypothetical protein
MEGAAGKKLDAADSMREQSQAAARTAKVVRDYVVIVAPGSGYVVKRLVAPGVLVQPGMAILKIAQIDRVRLQANVGEKDVASIRVGSPVTVTRVGANQRPLTVTVTSVFPFVDQGPRTAVVEATVDNSARRFLPGQYVLMQFSTGDRGASDGSPVGSGHMGQSTVAGREDDRAGPVPPAWRPDRVESPRGWRPVSVWWCGARRYAGARVADVTLTHPSRRIQGMPETGGGNPRRRRMGVTERVKDIAGGKSGAASLVWARSPVCEGPDVAGVDEALTMARPSIWPSTSLRVAAARTPRRWSRWRRRSPPGLGLAS